MRRCCARHGLGCVVETPRALTSTNTRSLTPPRHDVDFTDGRLEAARDDPKSLFREQQRGTPSPTGRAGK